MYQEEMIKNKVRLNILIELMFSKIFFLSADESEKNKTVFYRRFLYIFIYLSITLLYII